MASKIHLSDGRDITVEMSGKRTAEALEQADTSEKKFVQFNTLAKSKVWINPHHVAAVEDRRDLDTTA